MAAQGANQLFDLLRALRRRRYQILVPALLVSTIGIAFAVIVPKRYKLSTRIEIGDRTRIESDFRLRNPAETAVRREATSAYDHLVHYTRVKAVIEAKLTLWPEYQMLHTESERAEFIRERVLAKNLTASPTNKDPKSGTIFVDVNFSDENKQRAAEFLTDLTKSWLDEMKESDRATLISEGKKLRELVDAQAAELKDKEDSYYSMMEMLGKDPTAPSGGGDGRHEDRGDWTFRALEDSKTDLSEVELKLKTAIFERDQARERLDAEPPTLDERVTLDAKDPAVQLEKLQAAREALEEKLAGLRPSNSLYKREKPKLDEIVQQIEALEHATPEESERWEKKENPHIDEYKLAVRTKEDLADTLTSQRDELATRVKDLEQETKSRTQSYKDLDDLQNQVQQAQQLCNETRKEWANSDKSLQMLESSPPAWSIAQPPVPFNATATPNPILVSVASVVAGLAMGIALALGSEFLRSGYRSVSDLASVMSVPVLGAIDTIVTRRERRRVQVARAVGGLSTAMIVGTIVWVTWLWYSAPERLPLELQDAIERLRSSLR
jgi:capsular polysaccharide biosynthesis protein